MTLIGLGFLASSSDVAWVMIPSSPSALITLFIFYIRWSGSVTLLELIILFRWLLLSPTCALIMLPNRHPSWKCLSKMYTGELKLGSTFTLWLRTHFSSIVSDKLYTFDRDIDGSILTWSLFRPPIFVKPLDVIRFSIKTLSI